MKCFCAGLQSCIYVKRMRRMSYYVLADEKLKVNSKLVLSGISDTVYFSTFNGVLQKKILPGQSSRHQLH